MGGIVTVERHERDMVSFFVDDKLRNGESIMKRNLHTRQRFVQYVVGGAWSEQLSQYEDFLLTRSEKSSCVWSKFGYKTPNLSPPAKPFLSRSISDHSVDISTVVTDVTVKTERFIRPDLSIQIGDVSSESLVFSGDELGSLLLASLLPIYMNSSDYYMRKDSAEVLVKSNTQTTWSLENTSAKRTERLQSWLLGAAAMCDSTQLEACLADPDRSWVTEYQKVISKLPATVYLSVIDEHEISSKVVYCNSGNSDVLFRESTAIGANLHDIFSLRCSANDAELVHKAVFGAKHLKLCLMTDACTLRAIKPVYDSSGHLKYMLGIESRPFPYPVNSSSAVCEQPFQQVEDLLALLPLLIKFPVYNKQPLR